MNGTTLRKGKAHRDGHLGNRVLLVRDSSRNYPIHGEKDVPVECATDYCDPGNFSKLIINGACANTS